LNFILIVGDIYMFKVTKLLATVIMILLFTQIVAGETADELISKGRSYESAGRYIATVLFACGAALVFFKLVKDFGIAEHTSS